VVVLRHHHLDHFGSSVVPYRPCGPTVRRQQPHPRGLVRLDQTEDGKEDIQTATVRKFSVNILPASPVLHTV
jgi:hypothetical protein